MEAAIRWSPHSTQVNPRFLIIDVAGNRLRLCQVDNIKKKKVSYKQIYVRDKLPNYTAFDWSKKDAGIVGIGSASGEAVLVTLDLEETGNEPLHSFPIRHQRKCNSIAFSSKNLLAAGLDRVRNDVCLNIYDLNDSRLSNKDEPYKKLASSEAVSSLKFFAGQPDTLVVGVARQYVRIYDLRDSSASGIAQFQTRQVHNIAIDPLDENYFLSAGSTGDPTVTVWDQRMVKQRATSNDHSTSGAVLEFKPVVDNTQSASIWSLRYSGTKRGTFGVLANTGEFKVIELAQHTHHVPQSTTTKSPYPAAWSSQHYTKASHHLRYPWHDKEHRRSEKEHVIAYDFMNIGSPVSGQCALALLPGREVEVIKVPPPAPKINFSALEEIYRDRHCIARPTLPHGTVAEDLMNIQTRALNQKYGNEQDTSNSISMSMSRLSLSSSQHSLTKFSPSNPSHDLHEDVLNLGYPDVRISLNDYLATLKAAKRRVKEGYSLSCEKNKRITRHDPWIVEAWDLVDRMDRHASRDGMVGNGLDLKYLGISSIWVNELTMYDERLIDPDTITSQEMFRDAVKEIAEALELPPFDGVKTHKPENRQLCLSLCGWALNKNDIARDCQSLVNNGDIYKAIVLAFFQGYKEISLSLLRTAIQQKKLSQDDIGVGAVIACASPSSGVSAEQRSACAWMADLTSDPYLKSLLLYFISGEWTTVVGMKQLSLTDRVAVALKYLPDTQLSHFLSTTTAEAISQGSISGLILTGLTTRALDLLQVHISHHPHSVQDAVLLLSRACPLYIQDPRWSLWKDIYLEQMQVWRTFLPRTRYIKEHNSHSVTREGRSVNKPSMPSLAICCVQCQQNLALRKEKGGRERLVTTARARNPSRPESAGTAMQPNPRQARHSSTPSRIPPNPRAATSPSLACPTCGAQMPRCAICLLWLGSPDPAKPGAAASLAQDDLEARLMVFCMSCTHGFHGHHARDWFGRHKMCPVPDCGCMCGLLK